MNAKTDLVWGFEPQSFSGPIVEFVHHVLNLFWGNSLKGPLFGEILSNETIRIFIEPAFPGCIGMSKKEADLQRLRHDRMMCEFFSII